MKNVLVIPGTDAQIPLICKLQKMGYKVICINPAVHSPAFAYADVCVQADILDREFCLEVAKKENVIAVFSDECDIAMPTVAYVSDKLGLPSVGQEKAALYTNKFLMREFLNKIGMPCPRYQQCMQREEAETFFKSLDIPKMIMKPLDSNSSRGVFTIKDVGMIDKFFEETISYSKVNEAVLCEEYIEGTEFTVDGIVIGGKHHSLAISKKKHYDYNSNIACELYFSYEDSEYNYSNLREQNDLYIEQSKLPFGFTHAEYKYDGENFVLIEIGVRGGGNYISSHIVPYLTAIDTYELLVQSTLGMEKALFKYDLSATKNRCAVLKFFDIPCRKGKVVAIEGEEILKNSAEVIMYQFRFKAGDIIEKAKNDSARVGFYIAGAETREQLDEFMKKIENTVKIVLEEEECQK